MPINSEFKRKIWSNFNPSYVFKTIIEAEKFNPNKRVMISALGAWVIAPSDNELRRDAITIKINEIISNNESEVIRKSTSNDIFANHLALVNNKLKEGFYKNVYYPLGGLNTFNNSMSPELYIKRINSKQKQHIEGVKKVISIIHYHQKFIEGDAKYKPPSLKICEKVINETYKRSSSHNSFSSIQTALKERGQTAHLCYAASKVIIGKNNWSLLDSFCDPSEQTNLKLSHIKQWLELSKYIQLKLLAPLKSEYLKPTQSLKIQGVKAHEHENATLKKNEIQALKNVALRSLKKRGKNKPR